MLDGSDPTVTIYEVSARTGVAVSTLWEWARLGVIDRPVVGLHDAGRGRIGRWPLGIVERVEAVRRAQRHGARLGDLVQRSATQSVARNDAQAAASAAGLSA